MTAGETGTSSSFCGATSLFLRGGESDYVQVLLDGVPVNEPGGAFDFANLTTDNVDRIEIVRGPVSALYGSDAMTGVVQIFTRRGRGRARATLDFKAGTFGSLGWGADLAGGGEGAAYAFSLDRFTSDGALAFNNEYRNAVLSGLVAVRPDARTEASLALRYSDNELHVPTDGGGNLVDRNAFQFRDSWTLGLDVSRFFGSRVEGRLLLGAHDMGWGFDDRPDDAADTLGFFAFQSLDDVRRLTADARANVTLGRSTMVTAGVEVEQQNQRSFSESESEFGASSGSFEVERWNRAFYAQGFTDLRERLSFIAGARLEDNDAFGTFATYRLGAAYRVPSGTRIRAAVGTGLKEPTFLENFSAGFVKGNRELDPEHSRSFEIGVEQGIARGRWVLSGTYFDQRFRDLIQFSSAPIPLGTDSVNFLNVAAANVRGIETGLKIEALQGLALSFDYTYLHTEVADAGFESGPDASFVEGDRLLRRPTHWARGHAGYRLWDRGFLSLDVQWVGDREDLDFSSFPARRARLPAYTRVDVATNPSVPRRMPASMSATRR